MDRRFDYLYRMCIASIGIPRGIKGDGDFISVDPELPAGPKIPPGGIETIRRYYTNSIEEYRYLLALANRTRSRTGLPKKLKTAESAVRFLQYAKSQSEFMEFLSRIDRVTYSRIPIYSNPSILKAIPPRDTDTRVDPREKA